MTKRGQLSKKQLSVLADLFSGQGDEQAILDKHKISRDTYKKWLTNDNFIEEFNIRVTLAYHQSRALIASYSSLAAVKLVQLTESGKEETARKACLDIISLSAPSSDKKGQLEKQEGVTSQPAGQFSAGTISKLLEVLAKEKK
ncbi:MAG: hypothetical protein KAS75_06975 [Planctomycetes bacterium]|nr:hypothetical protein [Planctomycetota bacterium]